MPADLATSRPARRRREGEKPSAHRGEPLSDVTWISPGLEIVTGEWSLHPTCCRQYAARFLPGSSGRRKHCAVLPRAGACSGAVSVIDSCNAHCRAAGRQASLDYLLLPLPLGNGTSTLRTKQALWHWPLAHESQEVVAAVAQSKVDAFQLVVQRAIDQRVVSGRPCGGDQL